MAEESFTKIVDKIPEALKAKLTVKTRAIRGRLGPFNPEPAPDADGVELNHVELETEDDEIFYSGQKTVSGEKNGFGFLVYSDGSIYEGYFKDDMSHGRGRYISVDGDVYEGQWVDD